ncbi:MAG TPA: hypothetical protein PK322_04840 [Opitutaceae bacterium]|nr:hypothetical protein [Opitutaceae bacterium]
MRTPDTRKSFLSKLALFAVAAGTMPGLLWRRWTDAPAAPRADTVADAPIALRPDHRAVAREAGRG